MGGFIQGFFDFVDGVLGNCFNGPSDYLSWMFDGSASQINGDGNSPALTP
jgi:hypothetical protein